MFLLGAAVSCSSEDPNQTAVPQTITADNSTPLATAKSGNVDPTPHREPTVEPTAADSPSEPLVPAVPSPTSTPVPDPLILPLIELPKVLAGVGGCDPRPRYSAGAGGGTVPWPTPTPSDAAGVESGLAEIELSVFRAVGARVVRDVAQWTHQISLDMESVDDVDDARKLGWLLARVVSPLCDTMSLAPWPEEYESVTSGVADILIDVSTFGRTVGVLDNPEALHEAKLEVVELAERAGRLRPDFDDLTSVSVTTGSEALDFSVAVPADWHVTSIGLEFRLFGGYDAQLSLLESADGRDEPPLAGLRVRAIRRVPNSNSEVWTTNGLLLFPGYDLASTWGAGRIRLSSEVQGAELGVQIIPGTDWIYYVQSACSANDQSCIDYVESVSEIGEFSR